MAVEQNVERLLLSGSTDGRGIKITAITNGTAQTIHTAHATDIDEIYLEVFNSDNIPQRISILLGGTTEPDDLMEIYLRPSSGWENIVNGQALTNSLIVKAYAAEASKVTIQGRVFRLTSEA